MRITKLTRQRIFGISLGFLVAFFATDYYLDLGFFGRRVAKGLLILTMGVFVIWGTYFAPTRQELREDWEARKAKRNR